MVSRSLTAEVQVPPVFSKTTLSNGVRVMSERHTHTRAVAIGFWVLVGTRDESPEEAGISHFLEHLTFKGTKNRTSYQIAKALEEVGGELNAYTTREYTCYHALVLKDHWEKAIDVLADLVLNMDLKESHFQMEKAVVLQELSSSFENHEDHIYDEFLERAYGTNPLGKPILGNEQALLGMTRNQINQYYRRRYVGSHIMVSCAGNVDHDQVVQKVEKYLKKMPRGVPGAPRKKPRFRAFADTIEKTTDQTHFLLGIPSGPFNDPLRFEAFILNALLGGGMTSKLFQNVREKKGLSYSVHSSLNTFADAGLLLIYAGVDAGNIQELVEIVLKTVGDIRKKGVSQSHLKLFKTQVIGSILLGAEDVENRMTSLGINEMVLGRYKPVQEVIDEIEAVNKRSVAHYIEKYLDHPPMGGLLLGTGVEALQSWWRKLNA